MDIKLSIIIPTFNQEELILRCLESIPIREDIEVIVVDDGSIDNTYNNLVEFSKTYANKLTIIENGENKGVGFSRNTGLEKAIGEYIGMIDSDDYVYTDLYNEVINKLDGEIDIVYMDLVKNDNTHFRLNEESKMRLCGCPCKFIKRSLIGDIRFPLKRSGEDYYFNNDIQKIPHTELFTGIDAYHYNFPRKDSLTYKVRKGLA